MAQPEFVVFRGENGEFYFRLEAGNGEALLQSEGYSSKAGAENGAEATKGYACNEANYDLRDSKDGQYYFVIQAPNDEVVAVSEMYTTKSGRDKGIEATMRNAKEAGIESEGTLFQIFQGKNDEWYFRLRSTNARIVLQSEGYTSRAGAENGVDSVQKNSQNADRFEKRESKNGKYYFVLKAGNGQIIGNSQMYASTSGRDGGIVAVQNAAAASVERGE